MRDGWVETTLGDLANLQMGRTPSRRNSEYWTDDTKFPFCTIADMSTKRINPKREGVTKKAILDGKAKCAKAGTLLMSFKLTIGRMGFASVDLYPNEAIVMIENNPLIVSKEFLYFKLGSMDLTENAGRAVKGSTLNSASIAAIKLSLPPLAEQKRIVDLISSVDSYIEALQQQVGKARKSRNALLNELLTKGGDGWVETTLGNICDFINGDRGKNYPSAKFRQSHGIPFINAGHLDNGVVNFADMDFISDEVFERLGGGKIHPGDTLFCLRGSVGKFANVDDLDKGAIASSLVIIRPNFRVTKDFLMHYLDSELCASELKQSLTGAVQPNLSANNLKSFKVFLPNIETQNEIGDVLSHFNNLITLIDHLISSTKKLRSALLSDLLSGNHEIPTTYDKHIGAA